MSIAHLPGSFHFSADLFAKATADLSPADCFHRSGGTGNHMLWMAGHLGFARCTALKVLGSTWTRPWIDLFGRGAVALEDSKYPSVEEVMAAWNETSRILPETLAAATQQTLAAPPPPGLPSFDGKMSGVVSFIAIHEAYHVGQAAYLRRLLGHSQISG